MLIDYCICVTCVCVGLIFSGARPRLGSDADDNTDSAGLPGWILTASSDGMVRCWDFDRPHISHTVLGLDPGESRHVYLQAACHRYPLPAPAAALEGGVTNSSSGVASPGPKAVPSSSSSGPGISDGVLFGQAFAAMVAASESGAAGGMGAHFPTYSSADGVSMTWRQDHVRHSSPAVVLCQQPSSPLDNPTVMPGAFAHTSSPTLQVT